MRNSFFILFIILFPFLSRAQSNKENFQLGFTLTPNIGWMNIDDDRIPNQVAEGNRVGVAYGVIADLGFARNYYFSTGLTITSINGKSKMAASVTGPGSNVAYYTNKLNYIEIPLTLKLKSNTNGLMRFYGQFGLDAGVNIRAKQDQQSWQNGTMITDVKNQNISDDINRFRLGLIAGAGAEWNAGNNLNILTGLTFNNGFTNVFSDSKARNSYFALNLGVFF